MRDSKLIELLDSLNDDEWKRLTRFLDFSLSFSVYDIPSSDIKTFFNFLLPYKSEFQDFDYDIPTAFSEIFPEKPFKKGRLEKIMSALTQETEKFIIYQHAINDAFYADYALLQHFSERKLFERFERMVDKTRLNFQKEQSKEAINYLHQLQIEWLECDFQALYNNRKGDLNVKNTLNILDLQYTLTRMDFLATLLSQNRSTRVYVEENLYLLDIIDVLIQKKNYAEIPIIALYRAALDILMDKGDILLFKKSLENDKDYLTFAQQKKT